MPVMMISEVSGQSPEGYDGMLGMLSDAMRQSPGFLMHTALAVEGGWRIVEIWSTREDATRFFSTFVAARLPPGIRPKLSFHQLHSLVHGQSWSTAASE